MESAKKPLWKKWWFWAIIVVVFAIIGARGEKNPKSAAVSNESAPGAGPATNAGAPSQLQVPAKQAALVQAVVQAKTDYNDAPNELKKSAVRTKRAQAIQAALGGSREANDWVGTVKSMQTNSDGNAILEVELEAADVMVKTWNNSLSDMADNTLILQKDPLFSVLADFEKGQRIVFSGTFSTGERDYIKEASMSEVGSMTEPEFIFKFRAVKRYGQ